MPSDMANMLIELIDQIREGWTSEELIQKVGYASGSKRIPALDSAGIIHATKLIIRQIIVENDFELNKYENQEIAKKNNKDKLYAINRGDSIQHVNGKWQFYVSFLNTGVWMF